MTVSWPCMSSPLFTFIRGRTSRQPISWSRRWPTDWTLFPPDAPKFILGDFNHCQVQKTLKTYEQYVTCATTKKNSTIDLCYGSVPGAFRSLPMPPFGASYHNSILLVPIYKPICKRQEQTVISVKCWTETSIASLQACFDCTDWDVFYSSCSDLNDLSQTVSSYISFCVDTNIPCKNITVFPNNKPWVT